MEDAFTRFRRLRGLPEPVLTSSGPAVVEEEEAWPEEAGAPVPPQEAFDALYEGIVAEAEERRMCELFPPPAKTRRPQPLDPDYPCVVCGQTQRWDDRGIWRCLACWPAGEHA